MNESESLQYSILKFLKESERDINITSHALQEYFKMSELTFTEVTFQLRNQRLIGARDNGNWRILIDGERKLEFYKKNYPEKEKKRTEQKNFLSSIGNGALISLLVVILPGLFSIGYYFGTEKVNLENVDLKIKKEKLELEKNHYQKEIGRR